ncbi:MULTISPECIES: HAMP domain-containing sensor histidine kinase [unclassified Nocardioides]|uniref:HAMP domain-containing sensor histidine kinase n=1 Tax=unclassified Nocardioides TaxID=2615069 RepID=UPI001153EA03|nr:MULTISPECIES: HAMP domain-containing sensor histidine kinase [unclassified Nocardioides]TQK70921.1 signal transduction histidine kinase [Nocardioides sp. SLBN-35]WGX99692.1 HAMP domain-containing sensor histidine kinase [Nocardioides sp. QY071]
MRLRTTLAAVLVVAVALVVAAVLLVLAVRSSLRDAAETTAEHRASDLVTQVDSGRLPEPGETDDEPDDVVWQVTGADGQVVVASGSLSGRIPVEDGEVVALRGGEHRYVVVTEDTGAGGVVAVAASLEDLDETTAALVVPLLLGVPLLLVVVGATTWLVVGRALRPVDRIRAEVERISGSSLERRVPVPTGKDEIGRLARTMNLMLGRVQEASELQQQFVSDASHELRSPVASLRQVAEVAQAHPGALPEGELAATVLEESLRMQLLVDQLLVLARAGEGAPRMRRVDVDVDDLVLLHARRGGRPCPEIDTGGVGPGRVRGDAVALGQVVRNLLDNAVRHADRRVVVGVRQQDDSVVVSVEDDGPGVPAAERERVFERFRRLDEARARDAGGSGLGLAIVREVVAAHGGSVVLDSSPLGGARFVVRLPG